MENDWPLPWWWYPIIIAIALINIFCAVGLFRWKKWAFWGLVVTAVLMELVRVKMGLSLSPWEVLFVAMLWVLRIGGKNKAWNQLEDKRWVSK